MDEALRWRDLGDAQERVMNAPWPAIVATVRVGSRRDAGRTTKSVRFGGDVEHDFDGDGLLEDSDQNEVLVR